MAYINLYNGNPTHGGTDGNLIDNTSNIIQAVVNATTETEVSQDIAIRTETGYVTSGDTIVELVGINANKWCLEYEGSKGTYGGSLTIPVTIENTNTNIKLYTVASSEEEPSTDDSVELRITATIQSL